MIVRPVRLYRFVAFAGTALALGLIAPSVPVLPTSTAAHCPPGYQSYKQWRAEERAVELADHPELRDVARVADDHDPGTFACISLQRPEEPAELALMQRERAARAAAPFGTVAPGAYRNAFQERNQLIASGTRVRNDNGAWRPVGRGPLIVNDPRYDSVNGLGLAKNSGRIDSLDHDRRNDRLFALIGTGGVWMSADKGETWRSIGDKLPTQTNGALAWTRARGGTLVVVGGEHLMGGNTYTGLGAFWTNDLGRSWYHARGVPDDALGFQVAVDPRRPNRVYAATSKGLFRSIDAGRSYVNVKLPTGRCAGMTGFGRCMFANFVTDVVVSKPGGKTNIPGGRVLAAIGYRAGMATFPNGVIHSRWNGLYRSNSGRRGTFRKLDVSGTGETDTGFAPQQNIGRIELGTAVGPKQNHKIVYAIVQDAELFNGGVPTIDAPDPSLDDQAVHNTTFNGIYVSKNFGRSWTRLADTAEIAENPATGSSLVGPGQATLFAPGVQAWYNMWIKPDPTRQTADGVPVRVTFGLEEVWQNRNTSAPQDGTAPPEEGGDFKVIGPYFGDETCLLLDNPLPVCPTSDPPEPPDLTTHPDQHDALYIPDAAGGVRLVVGNDGGAYVRHVAKDEEFTPDGWGEGNNNGFHTLLPYDAEVAKDGTVWFGLQDNGSGKISPSTSKQFETFGGDGFFVAVDPNDSKIAYSETIFADLRVTTDGGRTWKSIAPSADPDAADEDGFKFSTPFVMDPRDPLHLAIAGRGVYETLVGPATCESADVNGQQQPVNCQWNKVFDLGYAEGGAPNSMSAIDVDGNAVYVGYCGVCDILGQDTQTNPFLNGFATNVGGANPPKKGTSQGWHKVAARGLPNRYITSIAIARSRHKTVYVTLGGYANREWVPPGSYLDSNARLGSGHVFKSTDGGRTFRNISGNLPNTHATWVEIHRGQLVVGTDNGVYLSNDLNGSRWAALHRGLPNVAISTIRNHPGDPDKIIVATYGRGVYSYTFPN